MPFDAAKSREHHKEASDIGPPPAVVNPQRKRLCKFDAVLFAQAYFPHSAGLSPLSPRHIRSIDRMQRAVLGGGNFLQIMFRGGAKSTLSELIIIWGTAYGHIRFPLFIAADGPGATIALESIKSEFETNDLLFEDFPEICHPVRMLEGKAQRCASQHIRGERTRIEWTAKHIVLPCVEGSAASGAIIKTRGITGNIRGIRHKRWDGEQARPDFIVLDDPQTDENARSPDQVEKNLKTLNKAILRLGGHKKQLAAVCNATIIEPEDMIATLADPEKFPAWQTEKIPMLEKFPADAHESLWLGKYADLRNTYDADTPGAQRKAHEAATEFYRDNREKMDAGCKATWLSCYDEETEVSAIQHAYNILVDTGVEAFMAECQNEPVAPDADCPILTSTEISKRQHGFKRGVIPATCSTVTAMIDVQGSLLYYAVIAWQPDFTGYVVDYGTWPDQKRRYFSLRDASKTLRRKYKGTDDEGAISAGLTDCVRHVVGREWRRDDGAAMRVNRCLIDANWGKTSTLVNHVARQSDFANVLTPSYGRGIKATQKPIHEWQQTKGVRCGPEWAPVQAKGRRQLVGCIYDANYWKKRFHDALALPTGNRGSISIFKADANSHRMFGDQLASEIPKRVEHDGRVVFEWQLKPGQDNHFLDCVVGSMVGASISGITNQVGGPSRPRRRRRTKIT